MLEGPDAGCRRLGGVLCILRELVPGLAESGVFEEGCHGVVGCWVARGLSLYQFTDCLMGET